MITMDTRGKKFEINFNNANYIGYYNILMLDGLHYYHVFFDDTKLRDKLGNPLVIWKKSDGSFGFSSANPEYYVGSENLYFVIVKEILADSGFDLAYHDAGLI